MGFVCVCVSNMEGKDECFGVKWQASRTATEKREVGASPHIIVQTQLTTYYLI